MVLNGTDGFCRLRLNCSCKIVVGFVMNAMNYFWPLGFGFYDLLGPLLMSLQTLFIWLGLGLKNTTESLTWGGEQVTVAEFVADQACELNWIGIGL